MHLEDCNKSSNVSYVYLVNYLLRDAKIRNNLDF